MYEYPFRSLSQPGRSYADKLLKREGTLVTDFDEVNDIWHYRDNPTQNIVELIKIYRSVPIQQQIV